MTDMTEMIDLAAQARLVARLGEHTDDALLEAPTPCENYAVRHLLGHLVGLAGAFQDVARKDLGPMTGTAPGSGPRADVAAGWRAELDRNLGGMTEAWRDPRAWEGETQAGGVTLPGAVAGRVALNELVLHGWDLARATGQDYAPARADLDVCHALLSAWAGDSGAGEGPFGAAVAVPEDAPLLDRVVALSGRRPDWAPPGA
ncbi:TIGR03086 family protein [Streptomyces sp. NBRC 13847]|uniref:TIGR03086 family metal-binding protein n=1 Tax=Streptomyces TaxID=1883 RepID=UPI0024A519E5|nr:TIGR03086 family metal-binding protein [Streptomyces sp. NBRC 13847]GLW17546.1 TIGR03086 family protein [Streptomyces sp. NBRC 13847]